MNYVNQPVEAGNQTNDATSPALELGKVIDPHPVYAAMAKAREAAEANGTEVADVLWDPASPELAVDDDDYWNDLTERNWETLSRWYAMALAASRKGETLHFKGRDGVETVTVINVAQPNIASEPTPDTLPAIISPVDGTGPQQAVSSVMTATTSPIATPQELTELRLKLHSNGYHPVPVVGAHVDTNSAGKRPTMPAWQTKCLTAEPHEIASWSLSQRNCTNTGILCGEIVGVDIDVLDEALSAKLAACALQSFGPTSLRRIGRAPKIMLVYRVEKPHEKLSTSDLIFGNDLEDKNARAKVEILAQGQQFVGFGIHPDTKAPGQLKPAKSIPRPLGASPVRFAHEGQCVTKLRET